MQTKTKIKKTKVVKTNPKKAEYSEELVQEVKEALEDYKKGRYFKGTVEEVIKHLRDEANRVKKVSKKCSKIFKKDRVLINKVDDSFRKLVMNPFDESLRTHKLKGNLTGLYASKVTDDVKSYLILFRRNQNYVFYY